MTILPLGRLLTEIPAGKSGNTMAKGDFCIVCGSEGPLSSDRMCESCLRSRVTLSLMPEKIQQFRCAKCGAHEVKGRWSQINSNDLCDLRIRENLVIDERSDNSQVEFSIQEIDDRTKRLHIEVNAEVDGYIFSDSHSPLLQTSNAVCPPCTRKAGDYFEAIVQLRSAGRKLSPKELSDLRKTLDQVISSMEPNPMFFVTKEGSVPGGWDLQMGSKALARAWGRKLVKLFGGTIKESSTVVGVSDGADVTRLTMSYRKPAYGIGDVIRYKKSIWLVDSWQKDGPIIRRMDRFERTGATWRDMERSIVVCPSIDQKVVQILNRDSSGAEFMDPVDYRVATVALPYNDDGSSRELRIGFIDGEWLAVPVTDKGGFDGRN